MFLFFLEKDIEDGRTPTEEVIDTLVKSYNSSDCHRQLQRQVAELRNKVSEQFFNTDSV